MKNFEMIIATLVAICMVMLAVLASGCQNAGPERYVKSLSNDLIAGRVTVELTDGNTLQFSNVVDYVGNDPAHLVTRSHEVFGIVSTREVGSREVETFAIYLNGEVEQLEKGYALLPRGREFILYNQMSPRHDAKMLVSLNLEDSYNITLTRGEGYHSVAINNVTDAWCGQEYFFWMKNGDVYRLSRRDSGAEPELFCPNANGVSHLGGEAEGALVTVDRANCEYAGRNDIYSYVGAYFADE